MDKQKIFNESALHLLKQNEKALNDSGTTCAYRGRNSTKCAIGALIPDDVYDRRIEFKNIETLNTDAREWRLDGILGGSGEAAARVIDYLGIEQPADVDFMRELQCVHDGPAVAAWPARLVAFAESWELRVPVEVTNALAKQLAGHANIPFDAIRHDPSSAAAQRYIDTGIRTVLEGVKPVHGEEER